MAEAATPGTTRPAPRRRTTATAKAPEAQAPATTSKPRSTKAAATIETAVDDAGRENYAFDLTEGKPTKSYSVWEPPAGSGCVGKLYAPLGTRQVRVRLVGGPAA